MKFIANKIQLQHTPGYFLKRAGYLEIYDKKTGKESFVRPIHGNFYPRFHIYIEEANSTSSPQTNKDIIFNLHIDMKKPSYKGSAAHSAEYEGEIVEQEIQRLKNII